MVSALWSGEPAAEGLDSVLFAARNEGGLVISATVYCELLAYPGASQRFVNDFLREAGIQVDYALSEVVWQQAAATFAVYANRRRRSKGENPKRLLVDFIIGAHAALTADRLMTLEASRYRRDFPKLRLV